MSNNLFDVSGTIVLVSGGSRGIGLAIATSFASQGATVIITGRNEESLATTCEEAKEALTYQVCDVGDEQSIEDCVSSVVIAHGRIDILINCAGINKRLPAEEYSAADFDNIMHTNLRGAFLVAQIVGRQMITQKSGNQINIDSLSTYAPLNQILPYAMSKSAMSSMTRGMAHEWGRHGVRVNGLAPGFILTDLTSELWSDEKMQSWNKSVTPLQRLGTTDDLVATAIFLASPGAAFLTGQTIRVDGGISAGMSWPIAGDFEVTHK